jgi:predicted nucleic acid-binding protein
VKVLVDTSVWADFFNGQDNEETRALSEYIASDVDIATCGLVVAEFFQGLTSARSVASLRPHFDAMLYFSPDEPATYHAAAELYRNLRRRGVTVRSTVDCLLARLAEENDAAVLARDRDVRHILESGLCDVMAAPRIG